jgi:ATP-binding cassette subfamily B protein
MLFSTLAEVVSLGAVLPFLAVLTAPERALKYRLVAKAAHAFGIQSAAQLVLPLAIVFAVIAILAGAIRMAQLWASMRFTTTTGSEISVEVYRRTLYQPYSVHVARSSDDVLSGITQKVGTVVLGVMLPLMTLLNSGMLLVALLGALLVIDPAVALIAAAGFGGSYALITLLTRRRLRLNSRRVADQYTRVIKVLQEGLGGIRDVILDGTQGVFCDIYRGADLIFRQAQGENVFISQCPRYVMEALGLVIIAALAVALSHRPGGLTAALPVLGALAIGAQRLMPALQQAYASWATIAGSHASLADTIALLDQPLPAALLLAPPPPLSLLKSIQFESVRFRYGSGGPWVLDGITLNIPRGARVGIVGSTGSGKSTLLDLMMALLLPTEGEVLVDGQPLRGERIRAWQQVIAHVPQSIYLADSTVAGNIAFGVPPHRIDMERVRLAARRAQIAEFIESGTAGYDARVGERGIRLSGGQRQRIGIARALYKHAHVLVLDEATSALDNATESSVMEAIESLDRDLTILLIAHRLSTVQRCDTIIELKQGRLVAQGRYEQLLESSQSFQRLANTVKTA